MERCTPTSPARCPLEGAHYLILGRARAGVDRAFSSPRCGRPQCGALRSATACGDWARDGMGDGLPCRGDGEPGPHDWREPALADGRMRNGKWRAHTIVSGPRAVVGLS